MYSEAIDQLNIAITINPKDTLAYSNRGSSYKDLREPKKALEDFNFSLSLDSTNYQTYNSRGIFYKNQKEYNLALNDYNNAIKFADEDDSYAYFNRVTYIFLPKNIIRQSKTTKNTFLLSQMMQMVTIIKVSLIQAQKIS